MATPIQIEKLFLVFNGTTVHNLTDQVGRPLPRACSACHSQVPQDVPMFSYGANYEASVCRACHQRSTNDLKVEPSQLYYSARNILLVYHGGLCSFSRVLTVENSLKWYGLHQISALGKITEQRFPACPVCRGSGQQYLKHKAGDSCYRDHIPNPLVVMQFATKEGYDLDSESLDMIVGRWERAFGRWKF